MKKSLRFIVVFLLIQNAFSQTSVTNPATNTGVVQIKLPATRDQLLGKWIIMKILKGKTEIDTKAIDGSYFIFGSDQTYQTKVLGVDESGKWQFGPENTSVILTVNGQKTNWNILKASDSALIMQKGIRGNTVSFSKN